MLKIVGGTEEEKSENKICPHLPGIPMIHPVSNQPTMMLQGCLGKKCRMWLVKGCGKALDDKLAAEKLVK